MHHGSFRLVISVQALTHRSYFCCIFLTYFTLFPPDNFCMFCPIYPFIYQNVYSGDGCHDFWFQ